MKFVTVQSNGMVNLTTGFTSLVIGNDTEAVSYAADHIPDDVFLDAMKNRHLYDVNVVDGIVLIGLKPGETPGATYNTPDTETEGEPV